MPELRPVLTMAEQSALIERLLARSVMHEGKIAEETLMVITADDVEDLQHLAMRLRRMSDFEENIKRLVMGR